MNHDFEGTHDLEDNHDLEGTHDLEGIHDLEGNHKRETEAEEVVIITHVRTVRRRWGSILWSTII